MSRAIDAEALARRMCELCNLYCPNDPCEPSDCVFVQAVKNAPTLTPQDEPLSWAELAEMAGNPVYIVEIGVREYWTLVKYEHNGGVHLMSVNDIDDYGSKSLYGKTWLAYRRPPERQEDT